VFAMVNPNEDNPMDFETEDVYLIQSIYGD